MTVSNIVSFEDAHLKAALAKKESAIQMEAESKATDMVVGVLNGFAGEKALSISSIEKAVQAADDVVYYSGDVEHHRARKTCPKAAAMLLKAASNQRYWVKLISNSLIRIEFDGDFFYDLYMPAFYSESSELVGLIIKTLEIEGKLNYQITEYNHQLLINSFG